MRYSRRRRGVVRSLQLLGIAALLALVPTVAALAASVTVQDFQYIPSSVTVSAGQSVTWTSQGPSPHTVTADGGSFDSGTLNPGQSFTHSFTTAGTFPYHCQFHSQMHGTV